MCGRYTFFDFDDLVGRFDVVGFAESLRSNFNVAPAQTMPVVVEDSKSRRVEMMKWGLIPSWSKDPKIGYKLINARSESAFEKPMWRTAVNRRRCLIPANGFYEWRRSGSTKTPFLIHPKAEKLFAFAGVWEIWKDSEGLETQTYSILTTEPNKEMAKIHNRMPVILHREDEASWLSPSHDNDRSAIEALLRPYEDGGLEMFEVSSDVNAASNNYEELMYPINA